MKNICTNPSTGTGVSVPVSGTGKICFLVSVSESVPALFVVPGHLYQQPSESTSSKPSIPLASQESVVSPKISESSKTMQSYIDDKESVAKAEILWTINVVTQHQFLILLIIPAHYSKQFILLTN